MAILRVVQMQFSSFGGASHDLQALHVDQLPIRHEPNVARLEGLAEPRRRERSQLSLAMLAHVGKWEARVHVHERAELRVVDPDVGDRRR